MHFNQMNLIGLVVAFCTYEIEWLAARHGLRKSELEALRKAISGPLVLKRGEVLFRAGGKDGVIYAVERGSFRTATVDARGSESLRGLYFEGDLVGLEALAGEPFQATAIALETSNVFRLEVAVLDEAMREVPGLHREVMRQMSRELWKQEERMRLLGHKEASARLAAFLLFLSRREEALGRDPSKVRLPMRRQDLAGFLGLATETVSRLLSRFARKGMIGLASRRVTLLKVQDIARVASRRYVQLLLAVAFSPLFLNCFV